jgi:transcriptional regulator
MGVIQLAGELKKGSAEFLILALVESRARHGYEIAQLIEQRSSGAITFHAASLYPLLYQLEKRGWIVGRWMEKAGERRKRVYRITREGRQMLARHRTGWEAFVRAIGQVVRGEHA